MLSSSRCALAAGGGGGGVQATELKLVAFGKTVIFSNERNFYSRGVGERRQQRRDRGPGSGAWASCDQHNSMPVKRRVLPRRASVGCFAMLTTLICGSLFRSAVLT